MALFSFPDYDASYKCCLESWSFFNAKLLCLKRDNGLFLYSNFNMRIFVYFFPHAYICRSYCNSALCMLCIELRGTMTDKQHV